MNPYISKLIITPSFSLRLFLVMLAVALLSIGSVSSLPVNIIIKLTVMMVIIFWLVMTLREHCWHLGNAITSVQLRSDDSWLVCLRGQEPVRAELLPGCLVQPWLTVLQLRLPDRGKKTVILLSDNVVLEDRANFRRIRVRLRFV
jgi:hypothetical protein